MNKSIIIYILLLVIVFLKYTNSKIVKSITLVSSFLAIISTISIFSYKNIIANISYIVLMVATILLIKETCVTNMLKNKNEKNKNIKLFFIIGGFFILIYTIIISIIDFNDIYTRYFNLIMSFALFCSINGIGIRTLKYND